MKEQRIIPQLLKILGWREYRFWNCLWSLNKLNGLLYFSTSSPFERATFILHSLNNWTFLKEELLEYCIRFSIFLEPPKLG